MKVLSAAGFVALMALMPAYGQDKEAWCTTDHMKQMDAQVAKMTDAKMQKTAKMNLSQSEAAMNKKDWAGCITHMEDAHKALGL